MKLSDEAAVIQHAERLHEMGLAGCIDLTLQPTTAIAVIASLQLALRHPGNKGTTTAKIVRKLVDLLIGVLDGKSPGLGALLRKGDDPACDVVLEKSP